MRIKTFLMTLIFIFSIQGLTFADEEFCAAIKYGDIRLIKSYLTKQDILKSKCDNLNSSPPLHWAVSNGQTKVAELLIKSGADVNDDSGMLGATPLSTVLFKAGNHPSIGGIGASKEIMIAGLLLAHGADPKAVNMMSGSMEKMARVSGNKQLHLLIKTAIKDPEGSKKDLLEGFKILKSRGQW